MEFGSRMEEPDLEEGEASHYKEDDIDIVDPDIALSYIGEKLQNVLGHLQKDFEGEFSKDALGAKFGGYGSFLPTYERSPPAKTQQRTPQIRPSYSLHKSLNNDYEGGASQNNTPAPPVKSETISSNKPQLLNIPKVKTAAEISSNKNSCLSAAVAEKILRKPDQVSSRKANPPDQKSLKVRIRVGSDNVPKKNAAIYCGLGLDSPTSSTENSNEDSDDNQFQHRPDESPSRILQNLCSFPVDGESLHSPLQDRLLFLGRDEKISLNVKPTVSIKSRQPEPSLLGNGPAPLRRPSKVSKGSKTSSVDNSKVSEEPKHGGGVKLENKMDYSMRKTTMPDVLESKKFIPHDTKSKVEDSTVGISISRKDAIRALEACVENGGLVRKREVKVKLEKEKEKLLYADLVKEDSSESIRKVVKPMQQEAKSNMTVKIEKSREHVVKSSSQDVPLDSKSSVMSKVNRAPALSKPHTDIPKSKKDPHIEQKVNLITTQLEKDRTKFQPSKDNLPLEAKKKPKVIQNNEISVSDIADRSASKEKKSSQKNAHRVRQNYDDIMDVISEQATVDLPKVHKFETSQEKKPLYSNGVAETVPEAPVVIEEDWVQCDLCQKWRLLPYGLKPDHLPDKWLCNMLNWLNGMNRCDISEAETTNALHAWYQVQVPVPESHNNLQSNNTSRTAPGVTSADVTLSNQNLQNLGSDNRVKKKLKPKETSNVGGSNNGMIQPLNVIKKPKEELLEPTSLREMQHDQPSKSNPPHLERRNDESKEKHQSGGDLKQKKLKSKRAPDHSEYETTKKLKTEDTVDKDVHLKDPKLKPKERLHISVKKHRDRSGSTELVTVEEDKLHSKKRKLIDRRENENEHLGHQNNGNQALKDVKTDSESRKEKKSRLSRTSETKDDKKGTVSKLPGSGGNPADKSVERKILPKLTMEDVDSLRRDLGSEQFSVGAASSSSKVSDSRKIASSSSSKVKGSPMGSVSSSPRRISKRSGDSIQCDVQNCGGLPVTARNRSGASVKSETLAALPLNSVHETDVRGKSVSKPSSVTKNSEQHHRDRGNSKNPATSSLRLSKDKNRSSASNSQKVTVKATDPTVGQDSNPKKIRNEEQNILHQTNVNEIMSADKKSSKKGATESRKEIPTKSGELTPQQQLIRDYGHDSGTKKDANNHQVESKVSEKSWLNPSQTGKLEIAAAQGSHPVQRATEKAPEKSVDVNGSQSNNHRNPKANRGSAGDISGSSSLKRDTPGETAASILKKAEYLKTCADNFKDSGFQFESNETNFQAALEFLRGAWLLESCNGESSKHAEAVSPIQVYTTAAQLCETCAQESEKGQEMAAAALAYKCMEVAYMRIVYCKSSTTIRDRHDLQASLHMVPQGESPSSSASDIDNLNNQTSLDRTALSRGISSHTGNQVIIARNRPNFVRLLDFTNDVNSAMEAVRKSLSAFAAAVVILEEAQNNEGIVCIKRAIDFSFQDVEGFIRLVKRASGAISRQNISSKRD
jgi:hypothetical protein